MKMGCLTKLQTDEALVREELNQLNYLMERTLEMETELDRVLSLLNLSEN